jgi:DNA-binding transcriptional ArsR family regulator
MVVNALKKTKQKLAPGQLQAVAELFAVLSEPTRLRILQVLQGGPASVGQIVAGLDLKQANASKQLGILYKAGVLDRHKEGTEVYYSIRMALVFDMCSLVCERLAAEAEDKAKALARDLGGRGSPAADSGRAQNSGHLAAKAKHSEPAL